MVEEKDQQAGSTEKEQTKQATAVHKHVFDSTIENPKDRPFRKVCACGHWESIEK